LRSLFLFGVDTITWTGHHVKPGLTLLSLLVNNVGPPGAGMVGIPTVGNDGPAAVVRSPPDPDGILD